MTNTTKRTLNGVEIIAPVCDSLCRSRPLVGAVVLIALVVAIAVACRLAWASPLVDAAAVKVEAEAEVAALQSDVPASSSVEAARAESTFVTSCKLDVPALLQYPELPTGCESVALVDTLRFYGFDVGKTEIADAWLPMSDTDFVHAFLGNPYDVDGNSCMAPALTSAANAYLDAYESNLEATDITGSSLTEVLATVSSGVPVIAWCTINLADPGEPYQMAWENDTQYNLYVESHCVVVSGYDLATGLVYASDPLVGQTVYPLDTFATRYYQMGAQAMVIS